MYFLKCCEKHNHVIAASQHKKKEIQEVGASGKAVGEPFAALA
jgi:hypothetical protein